MYTNQKIQAFKKTHETSNLYKNPTPLDKKLRQAQTLNNLQNKLNEFIFNTEHRLNQLGIDPGKIDLNIFVKNKFKAMLELQNNKKQSLLDFLQDPVQQEIFFEESVKEIQEKFQ